MKRRELELAIRAAGRVARDSEFLLMGSQAVHASCLRPPAEVLLSQECDLYPKNRPETANLLHAELGRGSPFARRHGFYVDVVVWEEDIQLSSWQAWPSNAPGRRPHPRRSSTTQLPNIPRANRQFSL